MILFHGTDKTNISGILNGDTLTVKSITDIDMDQVFILPIV